MGVSLSPKDGAKPIIVIDQATGISYGVGTTNGVGTSITSPPSEVYYLIKDANGKYHLVKK